MCGISLFICIFTQHTIDPDYLKTLSNKNNTLLFVVVI